MKLTGKRSAGDPHAAFDVEGIGNGLNLNRASLRPYLRGPGAGNSLRLPDTASSSSVPSEAIGGAS